MILQHTSVPNYCDLKGKVIIITGGVGFLGHMFSQGLSDAGCHVVIGDLCENVCIKTAERNSKGKSKSIGIHLDITDPGSIQRTIDKTLKKFGKIDILINNAGIDVSDKLEKDSIENFEKVCDVNLSGTYNCIKMVASQMQSQRKGNIINVGSIYGLVSPDPRVYGDSGQNSPGVYAATKGGIIQLTRYLSVHLAEYNIRVNCISPGGIFNEQDSNFVKHYSERVPMKRMARKEELLAPLLFLASEASSYITGHNLIVDGGLTAW